jgi:hypothetical protein
MQVRTVATTGRSDYDSWRPRRSRQSASPQETVDNLDSVDNGAFPYAFTFWSVGRIITVSTSMCAGRSATQRTVSAMSPADRFSLSA